MLSIHSITELHSRTLNFLSNSLFALLVKNQLGEAVGGKGPKISTEQG